MIQILVYAFFIFDPDGIDACYVWQSSCLHRKLSELTEKKKKVFQFFKMINVLLINVLVFPTN